MIAWPSASTNAGRLYHITSFSFTVCFTKGLVAKVGAEFVTVNVKVLLEVTPPPSARVARMVKDFTSVKAVGEKVNSGEVNVMKVGRVVFVSSTAVIVIGFPSKSEKSVSEYLITEFSATV